jgi:hypothetical protein
MSSKRVPNSGERASSTIWSWIFRFIASHAAMTEAPTLIVVLDPARDRGLGQARIAILEADALQRYGELVGEILGLGGRRSHAQRVAPQQRLRTLAGLELHRQEREQFCTDFRI